MKTLYEGATMEGTKVFSTLNAIPEGGHGAKFAEAVLVARENVYVGNQNKSTMQLKLLLMRNISDTNYGMNEYKFFHQGVLGDSPTVPVGIIVSLSKS